MVTIDVTTGRREDATPPASSISDTAGYGRPHVDPDPSRAQRAESQRADAAAILRLAAFRALEGLSHVDVLVKRALSHIAAAERIERGEA